MTDIEGPIQEFDLSTKKAVPKSFHQTGGPTTAFQISPVGIPIPRCKREFFRRHFPQDDTKLYWATFGFPVFIAFTRSAAVAVAITVVAHSVCIAEEYRPRLDELRFGGSVGQANSDFVHLEALLSPLRPGPTYAPSWLLSPRPLLGATISVQGKTDALFGGLTWSAPVPTPFILEASFGGTVHDQKLFVDYTDRPKLTTRFLFRESIAVGYQINPQWRVLVFADHESDGNLGYLNESVNHLGIELGRKFDNPIAERPQAPPPSLFSWGGPYFGISGGFETSSSNIAITEPSTAGTFNGQKSRTLIVGGQTGYNWPIGVFVIGIETDFSAQSIHTGIPPRDASSIGPYYVEGTSNWLATGRLRAGFDVTQLPFVNTVLIYGTGGIALANISSTFCLAAPSCLNNGVPASGWTTQSQIKSGWTIGGGIELPLAPYVTGKLEYLYVDLDSASSQQGTGTYAPKFTEQFVRGGLNFRFPAR